MLGDLIGELKGNVSGFRILSSECCPKMESSFKGNGKILGVDITDMGTFWAIFEDNGNQYGEGQGIFFTPEGIVSYNGRGIGKMVDKGVEWRGCIFFDTSLEKLKNLNNIVGVFEYNVDEDGNSIEKIWEWK